MRYFVEPHRHEIGRRPGAQFKLGAWAVHAEYERFNAAGGNPNLVSLGVTWTFL